MVVLSLAVAFVLSAIVLPESWAVWQPSWVSLVVIYWVVALPHRVSPLTGWVSGLLLDVLWVSPLGVHALALLLVAGAAHRYHPRLSAYSLGQQALAAGALAAIALAARCFAHWLSGADVQWLSIPFGAMTSALMWPLIVGALRSLQSLFHIQ